MQPTTTVQSLLLPILVQQTTTQTSFPPVPPRIRNHIIRGEFTGSSEPEPYKSLTLQLAPSDDDVAICQTSNPRKITSFSSWMEAWDIYLSIRIGHAPARAAKLVAYQTQPALNIHLQLGLKGYCTQNFTCGFYLN